MKDFYDVRVIASTMALDGDLLSQAVKATFDRRKTAISTEPLYLFSNAFTQDKAKQMQWLAFLNKNGLEIEEGFAEVVSEVQHLLEPAYQSIAEQRPFQLKWSPDKFQWDER